jgi:O-antigen ligase
VAVVDLLLSPLILLSVGLIAVAATWLSVLASHRTRKGSRVSHWPFVALLWLAGPATLLVQAGSDPDRELSGPQLRLSQALTLIAIVLAVVLFAKARNTPDRTGRRLIVSWVAYYVSLVIPVVLSLSITLPRGYWLTPLVVVAALAYRRIGFEDLVGRASIALRAVLVMSLIAWFAFPAIGFNTDGDRAQFFGLERVQGIAGHPNTLGAIAVVALALEVHRRRTAWALLAGLLILASQSNTSIIAAFAVLVVGGGSIGRLGRRGAIAAVALLPVVAIVRPGSLSALWLSFLPEDAGTLTGRTYIWQVVLKTFRDDPLTGYGPALLDIAYRTNQNLPFDAAAQAHNQFIQTLGQAGLVGALAMTVALLMTLAAALKVRRTSRLPLALWVALLLHCLTESPLRPVGVSADVLLLIITLTVTAAALRESGRDEAGSGAAVAGTRRGQVDRGGQRSLTGAEDERAVRRLGGVEGVRSAG